MNSVKQAIIASICEHPHAEKYIQRALAENPGQTMESLSASQTLTKADFFALDDGGKAFLDSDGAWKNFTKIAEMIRDGGEKLTYDDFMAPLVPGKSRTLLQSATEATDGIDKVFTVDIWRSRFDEMEKLWYKQPSRHHFDYDYGDYDSHVGVLPLDLKRQMFAAEGKTTPEDRLAKAKVAPYEMRAAVVNDYNFREVNNKLQQAGDYFRKEYVLMMDGSGDTMFDGSASVWDRFEAVTKIMQAHGERFEVKDYLRQLLSGPSLLARAAEKKVLNKVFAPSQWVDRLPDMLDLWSHVLDGWKTSPMTARDFDNAYAEAEGMTYAKSFMARPVTGKADLLTPLNDTSRNEKPVLPLGLKTVWENLDVIQAKLVEKNEFLTLADLRAKSGQMADTCLMKAVQFDCFDKVTRIAKRSGESLTMDDFLSKDSHGNTLISLLAEKKQLSKIFTVEAWVGHIADMRKLWSVVGKAYKNQVDYARIETGVRQAMLKQKKPGKVKIHHVKL